MTPKDPAWSSLLARSARPLCSPALLARSARPLCSPALLARSARPLCSPARSKAALFGLSTLGLATLTASLATAAHADTTYVTDFSKNGNLQADLNSQYPTGLFNASAFGGVSFDITPDGSGYNFAGIEGTPLTISVDIPDATTVYTMINGFAPPSGDLGETVTFSGTGGASEVFDLVNGTDVRDYYQGGYANTIDGTTTQNISLVNGVGGAGAGSTPQSSVSSQGANGAYVLDAQQFTLNSTFANQTLQSITIANAFDASSPFHATVLSGVTVVSNATSVPEPSSFALLLLGLAAPVLGLMVRRARRKAGALA